LRNNDPKQRKSFRIIDYEKVMYTTLLCKDKINDTNAKGAIDLKSMKSTINA
jgi:hypothetical protein